MHMNTGIISFGPQGLTYGAISFSRLIALRVVKRTGLEHRDRCQVPIRIDGGRSLQLMEVGA